MKPNVFLLLLVAAHAVCASCSFHSFCVAQTQEAVEEKKPSLPSRESQLLALKNRIDKAESSLRSVEDVLGEQHEIVQSLRKQNKQLKEMLELAKFSSTSSQEAQMLAFKPQGANAVFENPEYPLLVSFSRDHSGGHRGFKLSYQSRVIRRFLDTDKDEKLDLWIYYKGGVESYRESAKNKDAKIDSWQYTQGDSVLTLNDTDGDGKPDEAFKGNLSDLLTVGLRNAVREKTFKKTSVGTILPAGKHKIEDVLPPKRLVASIGGFASQSYKVEFVNGKLTYHQNPNGFTEWGGTSEEIQVTKKMWIEFRDQLNKAKVWEWRRRYHNPDIHDGTVWNFEIEYSDQSIASSGSNAGPGREQLKILREAVSTLAKKKSF